jgi:hypothetical protein
MRNYILNVELRGTRKVACFKALLAVEDTVSAATRPFADSVLLWYLKNKTLKGLAE